MSPSEWCHCTGRKDSSQPSQWDRQLVQPHQFLGQSKSNRAGISKTPELLNPVAIAAVDTELTRVPPKAGWCLDGPGLA